MSKIESLWNLSPLKIVGSRRFVPLSDIHCLSRDFYGWVMSVYFQYELVNFLSRCVPQREHIIDVLFPLKGFNFAFIDNFCYYNRHKYVGERDCTGLDTKF